MLILVFVACFTLRASHFTLCFTPLLFFFFTSYKYDNVSRSSWCDVDCWDDTAAVNGQRGRSLTTVPRHAIYQSWTHADGSNAHKHTHTYISCTHTCTTQRQEAHKQAEQQVGTHTLIELPTVMYLPLVAASSRSLSPHKSQVSHDFSCWHPCWGKPVKVCNNIMQPVLSFSCCFQFSLLCLSLVCLSPYLPVPLFSLTVRNPHRSIAVQLCLSFCFWFVFVHRHCATPYKAFLPPNLFFMICFHSFLFLKLFYALLQWVGRKNRFYFWMGQHHKHSYCILCT